MTVTILCKFSRLRQDWLLGPPSHLFNWHRRYLPGVEPPGRDADQSSPSSVNDEIKCSQTSATFTYLHGVERDNFPIFCTGFAFENFYWKKNWESFIWCYPNALRIPVRGIANVILTSVCSARTVRPTFRLCCWAWSLSKMSQAV